MTYKKASDKAQAKLRRYLPRRVGDFAPEPLSLREERDIVLRQTKALEQKLGTLKKGSMERKFEAAGYNELLKKLGALNKEIRREESKMREDYQGYLLQACRELMPPDMWQNAINLADQNAQKLGFRRKPR